MTIEQALAQFWSASPYIQDAQGMMLESLPSDCWS